MKDLVGCRFGRLVVLSRAGNLPGQTYCAPRWLCRCDCGVEKAVFATALRTGATLSCGCLRNERAKANILKAQATGPSYGNLQHGRCRTPEWNAWVDIRKRCRNSRCIAWKDYGGRGICICERWDSFECFLADMGPKPSAQHSIERRDNDGNYEPGNCYWATKKEQARNRRSNTRFTSNGITLTISGWAERLGVDQVRLREKLLRHLDELENLLV